MIRFVTIVSGDFWPGFAAMLQSLEENSGFRSDEYEIVAICDPDTAPEDWLGTRKSRVVLMPPATIPRVEVLSPQNQGERMAGALQKLGVFALPDDFGRCIFIDSDMVCLRSLRELLEMMPLTAACDHLCGFDPASGSADGEINTGLMVFEPSRTTFEELQSVYTRRHGERTHKGDQDVINMWLQETGRPVHRLGSEWNFSKRFQDKTGPRWVKRHIRQVRILHFVGVKPWTDNACVNTFRECRYRWMEEIWWDYFDRSGFVAHVVKPPRRSTARVRAWILPWTRPAILGEHCTRALRFVRRQAGGGESGCVV